MFYILRIIYIDFPFNPGIHLTEIRPGRLSGECFVELVTKDDLELALKKNKEHMGPRYIEGTK